MSTLVADRQAPYQALMLGFAAPSMGTAIGHRRERHTHNRHKNGLSWGFHSRCRISLDYPLGVMARGLVLWNRTRADRFSGCRFRRRLCFGDRLGEDFWNRTDSWNGRKYQNLAWR